MRSRHLLDPELTPLLDLYPDIEVTAETLPLIRGQSFAPPLAHPALASGRVLRSERFIPGPAGAPDVRVLVYEPADRAEEAASVGRPAILHVHGGGFIVGDPAMNEAADVGRAADLGCIVVAVAYRLAPENIYPAAVEDCHAALAWMQRSGAALGIDAARIAILGESAGGGLAAALALLARDRGTVTPVLQMLIYPALDDRTGSTIKPSPFVGDTIWTAASNRFGWTSLLGFSPGGGDTPAYAAAARAKSLTGLPPTFIASGALDLFVEEDITYAGRLVASGVPTELHIYPGAIHAFDAIQSAYVSRQFARDCSMALRRAFGLAEQAEGLRTA